MSLTLVQDHYSQPNLLVRLQGALAQMGFDPQALPFAELSPLDHFHTGGLPATEALAAMVSPQAGERALDVGSGIGGPARYLAHSGCKVYGIDLTFDYCVASRALTRAAARHLDSLHADFLQADACRLPFASNAFDIVWSQHVAMNIRDRSSLYAEMHRVLKPGGRLALHDVVSAHPESVKYPVPWAADPSFSALLSAAEMEASVSAAGFTGIVWNYTTDEALDGLEKATRAAKSGEAPAFGIHLLMGPEAPLRFANLIENLRQGACQVVRMAARK